MHTSKRCAGRNAQESSRSGRSANLPPLSTTLLAARAHSSDATLAPSGDACARQRALLESRRATPAIGDLDDAAAHDLIALRDRSDGTHSDYSLALHAMVASNAEIAEAAPPSDHYARSSRKRYRNRWE
jgi:hypothetical protein